ncbi:beta-1,4-galactosyltransferase 1-like isoform X2 [Phyllobates terribilis]|uniref:beta-1,4-galactosyltransferase 1-like isoform X2 n=1 Tax=Phyllobates terribilis TaxID=111132 RepID=UPI003CCA9B6C
MARIDYRKSFLATLCISVVFIYSLKIHFLDKYFEDLDITTYSRHSASKIRNKTNYWLSKMKRDGESTYDKHKELPDCTLPLDLGPYNVEVNVSNDNTIFQNANLPLGGHSKPDNCTALQKIAIVIPFRDREPHLEIWLHNMHPLLQKQQADYGVYVVEQHGKSTFNRAKLMNIGYKEAVKEYDYNCFIFSDVDIIPMDQRNLYSCSKNPKHMSNSLDKFNFRLQYKTLFGGVVAFTKEQFLKVNGFSNKFWGWGGEDDELYQRVIAAGMKIERRDQNISKAKAILHKRDTGNERNRKSVSLIKKASKRMHIDGLSSLNYSIISISKHRLYTKVTADIGLPEQFIN